MNSSLSDKGVVIYEKFKLTSRYTGVCNKEQIKRRKAQFTEDLEQGFQNLFSIYPFREFKKASEEYLV